MNSFSHYAFGAVCEWMFESLAGIQSDGPAYKQIVIKPHPPTPSSNAMYPAIQWVKASHDSIRGMIQSDWKVENSRFYLTATIPANTTATVYLPTSDTGTVTESNQSLTGNPHVRLQGLKNGYAVLEVDSGTYHFAAKNRLSQSASPLKTSKPKDTSLNPEKSIWPKASY